MMRYVFCHDRGKTVSLWILETSRVIRSNALLMVLLGSAASLLLAACAASPSASVQNQVGVGPTPTAAVASATPSPTAAQAIPGYGPGMGPGGMGPGMMSGGGPGGFAPGMGPGMMGPGGGVPFNPGGSLLTMDQAIQIANQYLSSANTQNLQLGSVHQFTNGYEAEYTEKGTDIHAFEILIDPYSGAAFPEMGPNVMWNTKYGHLGGMMGGPSPSLANTNMPVTADVARNNAQQWLNSNLPGATLGSSVDTIYGYYEIMVQRDGRDYGEIDVNGYSGQVWYEGWHGPVVQTREVQSTGQ